jgi:S1-C subfamily serine protease
MGFAIPAATIRQVLPHLRDGGVVPWAWSGLRLQPLCDFDRDMYFEGSEGVILAGTEPDSPAQAAGLLSGDRILSVNGDRVTARVAEDLPDLRRKLALLPIGEPVALAIRRGGKVRTISLAPRAKGRVEGEEIDLPRWDFSVKEINRFANPTLYFQRKQGVFVHGVKDPGNAEEAGLKPSDILLEIGRETVVDLDGVKALHAKALAHVEEDSRILLTVLRGGLLRQVVLDFGRDYERK